MSYPLLAPIALAKNTGQPVMVRATALDLWGRYGEKAHQTVGIDAAKALLAALPITRLGEPHRFHA